LHDDQTTLEEIFLHGQPRHVPWSKIFETGILTRDLFAVPNYLVFRLF